MRFILGTLCLFFTQNVLADSCCGQEKKPACACPCNTQKSWWSRGWGTTVFSGPLTSQTSSKIVQNADFGDSGIAAIAISKELVRYFDNRLGFEYEGQAVQHFGDQDHFELNPAILVARWWSFPWNKTMPTTLAIGDGVSIATKTPKLEEKRRGDKTSRTLNFVMAELTLSSPCYPQWAFVLRYHHRSGVFGTYHGVDDASTAFAAGVKYWF